MKKILLMLSLVLFAGLFSPVYAAEEHITINGNNGNLAAIICKPDKIVNGHMVILMHGFASQKNNDQWRTLAKELETRGIASIRFDFDGHGESQGRFQDMTIPKEIDDAKVVYNYVRSLPYVTSISFAGHSQGGVVAGMTAAELGRDLVKSVVLLAPAASLRDDVVRGDLFDVKFDPNKPAKHYLAIPGNRKVGLDYITTLKDLPIYEVTAKYTGPVFIIHGKSDTVVPYTCGILYKHFCPNSRLELIDRADHGFLNDLSGTMKKAADFFEHSS